MLRDPGPEEEEPHSRGTRREARKPTPIVAIGAASRRLAGSVRKSAIAIESGVARRSAMNEVTIVP